MNNYKERFSNRVDTYVKFRPSYPKEAIDYLYDVVGLRANDSSCGHRRRDRYFFKAALTKRKPSNRS